MGNTSERNGGCCSKRCVCCSSVLFLLILGAAFGLVFGLIPIDDIRGFFGMSTNDTNDITNGHGGSDGNGTQPEEEISPSPSVSPKYEFMQCTSEELCCNGLGSNCNLKPNEILWPTVHNAMHEGNFGNHKAPLEEALEAGYRGIQLDVCYCENEDKVMELVFCHGYCAVGKRTFAEVFGNINQFLDSNPTESIMINFEISVGNPIPTPKEIWDDMSQYQGINEKTYVHAGGAFPTMKELQQKKKQLLLFKHRGVDCSDNTQNVCSDRIMEHHKYTIETDYSFDSKEEIENYSQSCIGNRGVDSTKDFYQINHFVTTSLGIGSLNAAKEINEKAVLEARIEGCEKITKIKTNIVTIDFWQEGNLLEVAQEINKVRGQRRRSLRRRFVEWVQH